MKNNLTLSAAIFLFLTVLFFFFFGSLGFNPTDDGVVLAIARRLFEGQVPHKDFITIRPVGSALLHLPELIFGGEHTFYISRLIVCLQFAVIQICWVFFMFRYVDLVLNWLQTTLLLWIAFMLSVHTFALMDWTTIDGLFLSAVGLYLVSFPKAFAKNIGYFLLGAAMICKQNFLPVPFIIIFLLNDYKKITNWVYVLLPLAFYTEWLYYAGALADCKLQLFSRNELLNYGVVKIITNKGFFLSFAFILSFIFLDKWKNKNRLLQKLFFRNLTLPSPLERDGEFPKKSNPVLKNYLPIALVLGLAIYVFAMLTYSNANRSPYFILWGLAVGLAVYETVINFRSRLSIVLWLGVLLGWCAAVSIGYNTTALAGGILWSVLLMYVVIKFEPETTISIWLAATFLVCLPLFIICRQKYIYRQPKPSLLQYDLGKAVYGFTGIRTDKTTFMCMKEAAKFNRKTNGRCAVLFDFAGIWATSKFTNNLPADWIQGDELPTTEMKDRIWQTIKANRKIKFIIVQKYYSDVMASELIKIKEPLLDSVKLHYIKFDEGVYFDVYRK